jgi:hypothetical protein
MNAEIEKIRRFMGQHHIDQTEMAKRLTAIDGKKRGRAAVSKQLGPKAKKISETQRYLYWRALGGEPAPMLAGLSNRSLFARVVERLTECTDEQLLQVSGYLDSLTAPR